MIKNKPSTPTARHGSVEVAPRYPDLIPIVGASLVMGGILATYGYRGGLMEATTQTEFLVIVWLYILLCFSLLFYIAQRTKWLDNRISWRQAFYRRAVLQLFQCWLLPTAAFYGIFLGLSTVLPIALRESAFFYIDIYVTALLLLLVNAGYLIAFYMRYVDVQNEEMVKQQAALQQDMSSQLMALEEDNRKRKKALQKVQKTYKEELQALKEQLLVQEATFKTALEAAQQQVLEAGEGKAQVYILILGTSIKRIAVALIALFFMGEGEPWLRLINGEEFIATEKTLAEVRQVLKEGFFMVKRSFYINEEAISRCFRRSDRRIVLELKDKHRTVIEGPVEPDIELEKRILEVVDIEAENIN